MHVVILGAGQVGSTLAELLNDGSNTLSIVDTNKERVDGLARRMEGALSITGNAALPLVLRDAKIDIADMLIAVTGVDETNIVASQVAKSMFSTQKIVARIRAIDYQEGDNPFRDEYLNSIHIINPETEVTNQIKQLLLHKNALQVLSFANGHVGCASFKAVPDTKPTDLLVSELFDFRPMPNVRFLTAFRGHEALTKPNNIIKPGDELFTFAPSDRIDEALQVCTGPSATFSKVCIAGGGRIGTALAKELLNSHVVRLIEYSAERAESVAEELGDGVVHPGDATDETKLHECEVSDTDLFCAVTNDDEINVMSCLLAKQQGARRTVALLSQDSYLRLIPETTIDAGISPQRSTVSSILTYVREQNVKSAHRLRIGNGEIFETEIEGEAGENKVTGKRLSQVRLPKDAKFAAVVRDDTVLDLDTDPRLEHKDQVVVFVADSGHVPEALKPFRISQFHFI
ncbi:MAG: Trk system potassium transporter TrkA [Gammaproteobacteria bacterium]|nr:Trk system potassium transporter TrkA [Gammaproteobacteria bacterium]